MRRLKIVRLQSYQVLTSRFMTIRDPDCMWAENNKEREQTDIPTYLVFGHGEVALVLLQLLLQHPQLEFLGGQLLQTDDQMLVQTVDDVTRGRRHPLGQLHLREVHHCAPTPRILSQLLHFLLQSAQLNTRQHYALYSTNRLGWVGSFPSSQPQTPPKTTTTFLKKLVEILENRPLWVTVLLLLLGFLHVQK